MKPQIVYVKVPEPTQKIEYSRKPQIWLEGWFTELTALVFTPEEYEAEKLKWKSEWIDVRIKPLVTVGAKGWVVNEGVPDEFLAAVEVHNSKTNTDFWWIRHCVIEDETGLCVVSDDGNDPAGWLISDVQFYMPLPTAPSKEAYLSTIKK